MRGEPNRQVWGRSLVLASLAAIASACQPLPPQGPVADAGFVELDENTDPRFVRYAWAGTIGWLRVAGREVYMNGRRVGDDQEMPNEAHLRTGPGSGIRAEFRYGAGPRCRIAALDLREGNLYGESGTCEHELGTQQALARSEGVHATYHAGARGDRTLLTVITGQMRAWSAQAPSRTVLVGPMQEVLLRPGAVLGPRPVTPAQVRERTAWRAAFDWGARERAAPACRRYAGTAVEQNEENLKRSCGYTGPRWQSEYEHHYRWCVEVDDPPLAERENEARAQALGQCRSSEAGDQGAARALRWLIENISIGVRRGSRSDSGGQRTEPPPDYKPPPSDSPIQ